MNKIFFVAVIVAAFGSGLVSAQNHDPCRTCEIIIGIAKRHFHNNFTDQNALKTQLEMECQNLAQHGFSADEVKGCIRVVDNNIAAIFTELKNNPNASPRKICQDFQECPTATTPMPRVKRQRPADPCRICEIIVNIARHHFHNNITDKNALKTQLLHECMRLGQMEGGNATTVCNGIVNANIDQIFKDMTSNKTGRQTCQDIKVCHAKIVKRQRPHDPCRTCEIVMNIALHHFSNNVSDQGALQAQLLMECQRVGQIEGQEAGNHCVQIVNNNIAKIYNDLHNGMRPRQTCQDIGECPPATTAPPPPMRQKRQRPHDACRTCELIINIARHHFHNNITDKNALKAQLLLECQHLNSTEGPDASNTCTRIVNANIDLIYADMSTHKTARQTCQDLKECPQLAKREKRQRPHDPCRTCEIIVNFARYHFHNNINNEAALKAELLKECAHLNRTEGQAAADHCTMIVNTKIDRIYHDMSTNKTAHQTCQDIGECPMHTTTPMPPRVKRQRPHDPCRTCEIIMNIARHHFNNNITDKNALQQQLLQECVRVGQIEGDQASATCTQYVNTYIDKIFTDLSTGVSPRQTCVDCKQCGQ